MVATMNEDKKEAELLARRTNLVEEKLKELSDKQLKEFEKVLRKYRFVRNRLFWIKKSLITLNEHLEANQRTILMQIITRENYKSNQDYLRKISLEIKEEFYEFELEKIGIEYVPYQEEWELVKEKFDYHNLSEEEEKEQEKYKTKIELYTASLKMKVLQSLGYSFS